MTPATVQQAFAKAGAPVVRLFRPGDRVQARRRGPLVLCTLRSTAHLARVLAAFVAASRT